MQLFQSLHHVRFNRYLIANELLCLKLIWRDHIREWNDLIAVQRCELGGNVELTVVAHDGIAHIAKIWALSLHTLYDGDDVVQKTG